jgi:hypothetical protein
MGKKLSTGDKKAHAAGRFELATLSTGCLSKSKKKEMVTLTMLK